MPEDEKALSLEEGKVETDKKTQPEISESAQKIVEEAKEVKEEIEEEPLDQKERTKLGRKVERIEDTLNTFLEKMDTFLEVQTRSQSSRDKEPEEELPEVVSTSSDVFKVLDTWERKKAERVQTEKENYEKGYLKRFRQLQTEDPDSSEEVFKEMFEHFNVARTGNSEVDAELNYAKAKASLLSRQGPRKAKPNVRSETPGVSTDMSVESKSSSSRTKNIDLDPFAKEFVEKIGMKPEEIEAALSGETPLHLVKSK